METQSTAPKLYIGMDIHKRSWSVYLKTDVGEHKPLTIPPEKELLFEYVQKHFPEHEVQLTYEAGCCGFTAARYFLQMGWNVVVVNPADVPRMDKQNYQKTDKIDCRNLAKQLHGKQLKGIYIPDEQQDLLKSLLRQRAMTAKQLRSIKTRIKSFLLYQGIHLPVQFDTINWTKEFRQWLSQLQWRYSTGAECMASQLRMFEMVYKENLHLSNELRAYCRKHFKKDYYLLKSIPGVGGYLAASILAEIGDLRRFNNETQFASYVGIIPSIRNSGGTELIFGVTPRCRPLVRSYIIESAWVALRRDPEMQTYYRKHIGKNPKSIIVKIARKMLNRMLSVIKNETPYKINYTMELQKMKEEFEKQTAKQRG